MDYVLLAALSCLVCGAVLGVLGQTIGGPGNALEFLDCWLHDLPGTQNGPPRCGNPTTAHGRNDLLHLEPSDIGSGVSEPAAPLDPEIERALVERAAREYVSLRGSILDEDNLSDLAQALRDDGSVFVGPLHAVGPKDPTVKCRTYEEHGALVCIRDPRTISPEARFQYAVATPADRPEFVRVQAGPEPVEPLARTTTADRAENLGVEPMLDESVGNLVSDPGANGSGGDSTDGEQTESEDDRKKGRAKPRVRRGPAGAVLELLHQSEERRRASRDYGEHVRSWPLGDGRRRLNIYVKQDAAGKRVILTITNSWGILNWQVGRTRLTANPRSGEVTAADGSYVGQFVGSRFEPHLVGLDWAGQVLAARLDNAVAPLRVPFKAVGSALLDFLGAQRIVARHPGGILEFSHPRSVPGPTAFLGLDGHVYASYQAALDATYDPSSRITMGKDDDDGPPAGGKDGEPSDEGRGTRSGSGSGSGPGDGGDGYPPIELPDGSMLVATARIGGVGVSPPPKPRFWTRTFADVEARNAVAQATYDAWQRITQRLAPLASSTDHAQAAPPHIFSHLPVDESAKRLQFTVDPTGAHYNHLSEREQLVVRNVTAPLAAEECMQVLGADERGIVPPERGARYTVRCSSLYDNSLRRYVSGGVLGGALLDDPSMILAMVSSDAAIRVAGESMVALTRELSDDTTIEQKPWRIIRSVDDEEERQALKGINEMLAQATRSDSRRIEGLPGVLPIETGESPAELVAVRPNPDYGVLLTDLSPAARRRVFADFTLPLEREIRQILRDQGIEVDEAGRFTYRGVRMRVFVNPRFARFDSGRDDEGAAGEFVWAAHPILLDAPNEDEEVGSRQAGAVIQLTKPVEPTLEYSAGDDSNVRLSSDPRGGSRREFFGPGAEDRAGQAAQAQNALSRELPIVPEARRDGRALTFAGTPGINPDLIEGDQHFEVQEQGLRFALRATRILGADRYGIFPGFGREPMQIVRVVGRYRYRASDAQLLQVPSPVLTQVRGVPFDRTTTANMFPAVRAFELANQSVAWRTYPTQGGGQQLITWHPTDEGALAVDRLYRDYSTRQGRSTVFVPRPRHEDGGFVNETRANLPTTDDLERRQFQGPLRSLQDVPGGQRANAAKQIDAFRKRIAAALERAGWSPDADGNYWVPPAELPGQIRPVQQGPATPVRISLDQAYFDQNNHLAMVTHLFQEQSLEVAAPD